MTTAGRDFDDLMPHQIKVTGQVTYNDYGRQNGSGTPRTYRCLIDDSESDTVTVRGEEVSYGVTAYVSPVPIESTDGLPVDIEYNESVEILTPRQETRPLVHIERNYDSEDGVGMLHNIILRFS